MQTSTTFSASDQDVQYQDLLLMVQQSFDRHSHQPLFVTTASDTLFNVYLRSFPEEHRQHYNCHTCRKFMNWFGGLVVVTNGQPVPVMWDFDVDGFFQPVVEHMAKFIRQSKIVDTVRHMTAADLGIAQTGEWLHFAVKSSLSITDNSRRQDYITVKRALSEFSPEMLDRALVLLRADALYRSEKVLGQAEWLRLLVGAKDNQVWQAVATAPAGFCHPRSSMIGTLLEDLESGMSTDDAGRRFAAKMHPLQYQRPTAAPSDQTIKQAEGVVAKLQAAGSLRRRFLRPDEVKAIWTPKADAVKPSGGVFDSLKKGSKASPAAAGAPVEITWDKFRRTVLPNAEKLFCRIGRGPLPFVALVTAADPASPPIIQWDSDDNRNPVSWYVYHGGSLPSKFALTENTLYPVAAVTLQPNQWTDEDKFSHSGAGACFVIQGCKDVYNQSLGLFPEIMRTEFHGVRKVIEAYSLRNNVEDDGGPAAAGLIFQKGNKYRDFIVEVETLGQRVAYKIDRWD